MTRDTADDGRTKAQLAPSSVTAYKSSLGWKERAVLLAVHHLGRASLGDVKKQLPQDSRQTLHIILNKLALKGEILRCTENGSYLYYSKQSRPAGHDFVTRLKKISGSTLRRILANLVAFELVNEHDIENAARAETSKKRKKEGT